MTEDTLQRRFTAEDHLLMDSYADLVDSLAAFAGLHCEVVLHSLESLHNSVIKIANGFHTKRSAGAPITDMALELVKRLEQSSENFVANYMTRTDDGLMMRSTTMGLRNSKQQLIGLLCFNMNISAPFHELAANWLPVGNEPMSDSPETFASNVEELVTRTIERTIHEINQDPQVGNQNKNKLIVTRLHDKRIFDIKDAVLLVASKLGISKHTVYLYIRQHKQEEHS
ncbi:helix-turn-helix transcriptional regulator [Dongshaea marina]|uniref:helix-turn-helix transcriptional regulator n=1 Tax=Dongshaea marina TaxID=2047966 RepID=UPI001F1C15DF|nr:PAS domain-containing protein [Dongshaea marina]